MAMSIASTGDSINDASSSWSIPQTTPLSLRNLREAFNLFLEYVNVVDHGEFEEAARRIITESENTEDATPSRPTAIAIQRCRRGGKTFMLHAVAALLQDMAKPKSKWGQLHTSCVMLISLSGTTPFNPVTDTNAHQAILLRVAWELSGREGGTLRKFRRMYKENDFGAADEWLTNTENRVLLLIDELNVIPPNWEGYNEMSELLDNVVQQKGCALFYSTHQRSTEDLLRKKLPGGPQAMVFSRRPHHWVKIPRIETEKCVQGLFKKATWQPSLWCSVLRGRMPALAVQKDEIAEYAKTVMQTHEVLSEEERIALIKERSLCLSAVITGKIDQLPNEHNHFRAYSYRSDRFNTDTGNPSFAWPPFMVAQRNVLGKNYPQLRATLEKSNIDEAKAFEALVQLAVLVRLLAKEDHELVPCHPSVKNPLSAHLATEMLHVGDSATTLKALITDVTDRYKDFPETVQVVAVPMYASFPTYDFFLLHREERNWNAVVGYQCKQGRECPVDGAWKDVAASVWVEGKCRQYRVQDGGKRVAEKGHKGWKLLSDSNQANMLGITAAEALPQARGSAKDDRRCCQADTVWDRQHTDSQESQSAAKRQRLEL